MNLTREEINREPAGMRMNGWVAVNVMKMYHREDGYFIDYWGEGEDDFFAYSQYTLPRYSTDFNEAFTVVEKMDGYGEPQIFKTNSGKWCAAFVFDQLVIDAEADTAPLAICRIALLAKLELA